MRVIFINLAVVFLLVSTPALGNEPPLLLEPPASMPIEGARLDGLTLEAARVIRCPVCQGLSVADSPATSAVAMKEEVRQLLAAGYTPEQVLNHFERAYGEFIRLEPKAEGFNWLVWLAPVVALFLGVAAVAWRLRGAAPQDAGPEPEDPPTSQELFRQEIFS